jgi:hypothetical protein
MADIEGVVDLNTLEQINAEATKRPEDQPTFVPDTNIEGAVGYEDLSEFNDTDNMVLSARASFHRTIADYAESVPIANEFDWWKRRVVEPWREEQHRLEESIKYESAAERIAGELVGGFVGLGMAIPIDTFIGGKILKGAKLLNPKLYSVLTATRKTGQLAGTAYMPVWGIGMTARHGVQTFTASDHDVLETGLAVAESAAQAFLFGAMPRSVIGGTWGMFTAGVASQGIEDIKHGRLSDVEEYLFTAANFVGMHAALAISHQITASAGSEYERQAAEAIGLKIATGKAALDSIETYLADPNISSGVKDQLRDMRSAVRLEMDKDWRTDDPFAREPSRVNWDEVYATTDAPRAKYLNSGLIEKSIEEGLMAWESGKIELEGLLDKNPHVAKAIEEGYIEYDDRARTWNWNPDLIPTPNANVTIIAGAKEPKFKWKPLLGSEENPISPDERGVGYMVKRLTQSIAGGKQGKSPFTKAEVDQVRHFLTQWANVDLQIVKRLTLELVDPQEWTDRVAQQLEYNKSLTPEEAKWAAERQESGTKGMYDHNMLLIDLFLPFTGGRDAWSLGEVFTHEFGHHLTHYMPREYARALVDEWKQKKNEHIASIKNPFDRAIIKEYIEKGIVRSSDQAVIDRANQILEPEKLYRFVHPAEFWAETVRDMFRKDYQGKKWDDTTKFGRLMNVTHENLIAVHQGITAMLKSNRYLDVQSRARGQQGIGEQIYRAMLKGDIRTSTEGFYQHPEKYFDAFDEKTGFAATKQTQQVWPKGDEPMLLPKWSSSTWRNEVPRPLGMTIEEWREFRDEQQGKMDKKIRKAIEVMKQKNGEMPSDAEVVDALMADPENFDIRLRGERNLRAKMGEVKDETRRKAHEIMMELYRDTGDFQEGLYRSINTKYLQTSNQEARELVKIIAEEGADFLDTYRNPRTFESIKRGAEQMDDIDLSFAQKLKKRTTNLARDVLKARTALTFSLQRLATLKAKTLAEDATATDADMLKEWFDVHLELHANVAGSISEIGRALGAMRLPVTAEEIFKATSLEDLGKKIGKRRWPMMSAFVEAYKGWLFSNPATHGVNFAGNTSVQIGNIVEDYISVMIGKGAGSFDRLTLREANAKTAATLDGLVNGLSYTLELLAEGTATAAESGMAAGEEVIRGKQIAPYEDKWNPDTKAWSHKAIWGELDPNATSLDRIVAGAFDTIGTVSRAPLHALSTSDGFFRQVSFARYITERAVQEAYAQGLQGDNFANFVAEFKRAHLDVFEKNLRPVSKTQLEWGEKYRGDGQHFEYAWKKAQEDVFAHEANTQTSGLLGQASEAGRHVVAKFTPLQILFPTWKTPMNILRYIGQRTPGLHKFSSEMTADIEAGGRRRDQAYAKLAFGTMLYGLGLALAMGGSTMSLFDKKGREAIESAGGMNDSLRVGDKFYSLDNADPVGSFFLLPARLLNILQNSVGVDDSSLYLFGEEFEWLGQDSIIKKGLGGGGRRLDYGEVIGPLIAAFSSLYTDKTFTRTLREFLDILSGESGKGKRFVNNIFSNATTPLNGFLRFLMQGQGELMREAETFTDAWWKDKAPHYVKPRFDIFGRARTQNERWGYVTRNSTFGGEPIDKEILRLELPIAKIKDDEWRGVEMTEEQQVRYNKILEDLNVREVLNNIIKYDPQYRTLADVPGSVAPGTKGAVLAKIISGYRKGAWGVLVNEDMQANEGVGSIPSKLEQHIMEGMETRETGTIGFQKQYELENLNTR